MVSQICHLKSLEAVLQCSCISDYFFWFDFSVDDPEFLLLNVLIEALSWDISCR